MVQWQVADGRAGWYIGGGGWVMCYMNPASCLRVGCNQYYNVCSLCSGSLDQSHLVNTLIHFLFHSVLYNWFNKVLLLFNIKNSLEVEAMGLLSHYPSGT